MGAMNKMRARTPAVRHAAAMAERPCPTMNTPRVPAACVPDAADAGPGARGIQMLRDPAVSRGTFCGRGVSVGNKTETFACSGASFRLCCCASSPGKPADAVDSCLPRPLRRAVRSMAGAKMLRVRMQDSLLFPVLRPDRIGRDSGKRCGTGLSCISQHARTESFPVKVPDTRELGRARFRGGWSAGPPCVARGAGHRAPSRKLGPSCEARRAQQAGWGTRIRT